MTTAAAQSRPFWMIGRDNFRHGSETWKSRQNVREEKDERQLTIEHDLTLHKPLTSRRWSRKELQTLWHLRYERKPKATYDMLAKHFGNVDTQVIVDALTELRRRKEAGEDLYKPFGCEPERIEFKPKPKPQPKPKPKPEPKKPDERLKVQERTKMMVVYKGMGMSPEEIADQVGQKPGSVVGAINRLRRKHPNLYSDLIHKGEDAKETQK